jgi:excisionase family DNA binding protein
MNEYKMEMAITCATGDADHFYNTVLMIAKGFEIGVLESKLGPLEPDIEKVPVPLEPTPERNIKKTLSIKEAAEYLNVSKGTLYKYTSEATIPFYKVGSRILFKTEELDAWLKELKVK